MALVKQLQEIQILQCSLLPPELFAFILPQEDHEQWLQLLRDYSENGTTPEADWQPASTCRFQVRVHDSPLWFEVELPRGYPEKDDPLVYVKGENLHRDEQEKWQAIIQDRLRESKVEVTEFVVQNLLCLHLVPLLHDEARTLQNSTSLLPPSPSRPAPAQELHHALLTSHHLISPTKRRNLQKWSSELSLRGFAKVGYPGAIYAEGAQHDIAEFIGRIKAMQWLALRVRFEENINTDKYGRLDLGNESEEQGKQLGRGKWIELEKVGEVVDLMRRSGREEFVTEMGLGSTSASNVSSPRS